MRSGGRTGVALLILVAASQAAGQEIELRSGHVGLRAAEGPSIERRTARAVLDESRRAYDEITDALGLDAGHVFHLGRRTPFWMRVVDPKTPVIWVHLEERPRLKDRGLDAYLERARRGLLRVFVAAPAGEIGPDDVHRIRRAMARAILAQTTWRALPVWLREGLVESLAGRGGEAGSPRVRALRDELAALGEAVPVAAVLGAEDRPSWARRGGRAVSWGLTRLLEERDDRIVPHLYTQVRMLLAHLVSYPDEPTVIREHVELVRDRLREHGAAPGTLRRALTAWVKEGMPTGRAFGSSAARELLAEAEPVELPRVRLAARFGSAMASTDPYRESTPVSGGAAWSLPWPTKMQAWIGIRAEKDRPRPGRDEARYALEYRSWSAEKSGRRKLRRRNMGTARRERDVGFVWLGVTSPNGVRYLYEYEVRLR